MMQVPEREIACGWSSESAVDTRFPVEIWREEANHGHPEQQATARVNGWRFHLLPARPHLGSGGWSYLRPRAAIVNRGLRVEGKKEHQGAERDWHRAPQLLVLHDSKSHSLSCLTRRFRIQDKSHSAAYYTCEAGIGAKRGGRVLSKILVVAPPLRTDLASARPR